MYLNCKTYFSFLYGTFGTEELVKAAAEQGAHYLALTNINSTADIWDFTDFCIQQGIKPVAGAEIRNDNSFLYILLARNNQGLSAINRFLTQHLQQKSTYPDRPSFDGNVFIIYSL